MLERDQEIATKEGLIDVMKEMLDQTGAEWGIVHQDTEGKFETSGVSYQ